MKNRKLLVIACLISLNCGAFAFKAFADEVISDEIVTQQKNKESQIEIHDQARIQKDDKEDEENQNELADPLYYVNYSVYLVNDKLYYWLLKPVTTGFTFLTPEVARVGFSNIFSNLREPVNFTNSLFQLKFDDFSRGVGRFVLNSTVGIGGIFNVSCDLLDWCKKEADFGQTLGFYGIGQGIYLVWPIFGPSSLRDTVGLAGDTMLSPPTYIGYFYLDFLQSSGVMSFEKINNLSFGTNYELLNSAVDPYIALKTAYEDSRALKIKQAHQR
jgi:phospholipid-binding lipoprotein MlaA